LRGRGDTIQSRLLSHLASPGITHYSWEIIRAPSARAAQIERALQES
jgi:hypothetical protein